MPVLFRSKFFKTATEVLDQLYTVQKIVQGPYL